MWGNINTAFTYKMCSKILGVMTTVPRRDLLRPWQQQEEEKKSVFVHWWYWIREVWLAYFLCDTCISERT